MLVLCIVFVEERFSFSAVVAMLFIVFDAVCVCLLIVLSNAYRTTGFN